MPEFIDVVRSTAQAVVDKKMLETRAEEERMKTLLVTETAAVKMRFTVMYVKEIIEKEAAKGRFSARIDLYENVAGGWPHWSDAVGAHLKSLCEEMGFSARYNIDVQRPDGKMPYYTGSVRVHWEPPRELPVVAVAVSATPSGLRSFASWFGI